MSDTRTPEEEPSIEEILASIRQIISDDDDEQPQEKEVVEKIIEEDPVEEPPVEEEDVLELTEDHQIEDEDDDDDYAEMEVELRDRLEEIRSKKEVVEPEPAPLPPPAKTSVPSDILSSNTQSKALDSLSKLATKMPIERSRSYDGITLEDIVRELLHPMLREWMDDNLPPMVERIVQKELEKLARRAMDD